MELPGRGMRYAVHADHTLCQRAPVAEGDRLKDMDSDSWEALSAAILPPIGGTSPPHPDNVRIV